MLKLNVVKDDVLKDYEGTPSEIMAELSVGVESVIKSLSIAYDKNYESLLQLFFFVMTLSVERR